MFKKVDAAVIFKYAVILHWILEPIVSHEMSWALIKANIREIDARFILAKGSGGPSGACSQKETNYIANTRAFAQAYDAAVFGRSTCSGTCVNPCSTGTV